MYKVLHNSRCGKSRDAINLLNELNENFTVREYLKDQLTINELREIISILKIKPIDLVRTKESIWKDNFQNLAMTDEEIIKAMVENPKLIERPVVYTNENGVIGRPIENLIEFINQK